MRYRLMGLRASNLSLAPSASSGSGSLMAFLKPAAPSGVNAASTSGMGETAHITLPSGGHQHSARASTAADGTAGARSSAQPAGELEPSGEAGGGVGGGDGGEDGGEVWGRIVCVDEWDAEEEEADDEEGWRQKQQQDATGAEEALGWSEAAAAALGYHTLTDMPDSLSQEDRMLEAAILESRREAEAAAEFRKALEAFDAQCGQPDEHRPLAEAEHRPPPAEHRRSDGAAGVAFSATTSIDDPSGGAEARAEASTCDSGESACSACTLLTKADADADDVA